MKKRYEVEVTEADCKEGVRGDAHYCVVSTAIERAERMAVRIQIDAQTIRFSLEEDGVRKRVVYLTPHRVRDYIIAFDAGDELKPFSFALENPVVSEIPVTKPGTARTISLKAAERKGTGPRRSRRVFGERSFRANQLA